MKHTQSPENHPVVNRDSDTSLHIVRLSGLTIDVGDNGLQYENSDITFPQRLDGLLCAIKDLPDNTGKYVEIDPNNPDRKVLLTDLERASKGWKLHLNFDPDDIEKFSEIYTVLSKTKESGAISYFKIADGGGSEDDPGKEATVYVGDRRKTALVAQFLEDELGGALSEPEGDAIKHDIAFTGKIMGRFEVSGYGYDLEFHQYGVSGFPYLKQEYGELMFAKGEDKPGLEVILEEKSLHRLRQKYGDYFTG